MMHIAEVPLRAALLTVLVLPGTVPATADTFFRSATIPVGPNPSAVAAADLNDDGLPDIVTADRGVLTEPREERPANDELSVLLAQEPLEYERYHPSLKSGFAPYAIAIANIDALKWPDIVVANFHAVRQRHIALFLNLKNEGIFKPVTFEIPVEGLSYHQHRDGDNVPLFTKPGLTAVRIRDFDGDSLRDLVAASWSSDVLVYMPGHAEKYFGAPRFLEAPGAPRDLDLADFDGDGNTDLVVCLYATGEAALWRGDGAGGFEEIERITTRGRLPAQVRAADFNNDGHQDFAVAQIYTEDSVVICYGDGEFGFSVSQELALGEDRDVLEHEIRDLAVADFDNNGRPDLAAACFASQQVAVFMNRSEGTGLPQRYERER